MTEGASARWKQTAKWLPGVIVSAIALYAVFHLTKWQDLTQTFKTVKIGFLVLLAGLDILSLVIRGKAWQIILGKPVTWVQSFFGINEGYFLNNLFPLRAGEIGRSVFVGRSSGLGVFRVLSTIVIERAFDIAFAAGFVIITLPFVLGMAWVKPVAYTALALVVIGLLVLFFVARNQQKVITWLNKVFDRSQFIKSRILPQVEKLIDGFGMLTRPSQFLWSFFWIGATWLLWIAIYYSSIAQIQAGAPLWWGMFVSAILALGVAIPSAPAALGVYEASYVAAMVILGINGSTALAYAIVLHFMQFAITGIFGIWGLVREGLSISSLLSGVPNKREQADQIE